MSSLWIVVLPACQVQQVCILSRFLSGYCRRGKTFLVYAVGAPREQGNSFVVKFNPMGKKDPYLDDVRSICV